MKPDGDWRFGGRRGGGTAMRPGMGMLKITLALGVTVIVLCLFAVSLLEQYGSQQWSDAAPAGIDFMSTGSVARGDTYTLRRSVLQPTPASACLIRANGARSGAC
ncbi:hypothetical protein ACFPLB_14680 [Aquamicrobium segne]|uniref:Uncharacterized protein n=1 Tax=Aquamicrobium segne TaxID=469547 RepID=A0ABW0H0E6_9HYPH